MRSAFACLLLASGCLQSRLVVCADGTACPVGDVCVGADLGGCARPEQLTACDGQADGAACDVSGFSGACKGGVCVACDATSCTAPGPRDKLVWVVPDGMTVRYAPFGSELSAPEVPTIEVGPLSGPTTPVGYSVSDGSFEIPLIDAMSPHRVVYDLPGDPTIHEIQWAVAGATIVHPRTSRLDAPAVPANSGYSITPSGLSASPAAPSIATSGVFTFDASSSHFDPASFSYRYAAYAKPLAGSSIRAPEAARGDWILVADWAVHSGSPSSQVSYDGWAIASVDLTAGTLATPSPEPQWMTTKRTLRTTSCGADCIPSVSLVDAQARLDQLGPLVSGGAGQSEKYGVTPSLKLPAFAPGSVPGYDDGPLMIPFSSSTSIDSVITVADPSSALGLDRILYVSVYKTRAVGTVLLRSSIQAVTNVFTGALSPSAPLVGSITLGTTDLVSTEGVAMPASSAPLTLNFTPLDTTSTDDYLVTLYELNGTAIVPVREYQVLEPSVSIDGSLLVASHTYGFAITSRVGFPGAKLGDYTQVIYPFSTATTMTRTFTVQ